MSKETFDFSEALNRLKEGKKVKLTNSDWILSYDIENTITISKNGESMQTNKLSTNAIFKDNWEEVGE